MTIFDDIGDLFDDDGLLTRAVEGLPGGGLVTSQIAAMAGNWEHVRRAAPSGVGDLFEEGGEAAGALIGAKFGGLPGAFIGKQIGGAAGEALGDVVLDELPDALADGPRTWRADEATSRDHFESLQHRFDRPASPYVDDAGNPVIQRFAQGTHDELGDFWIRGSQVVWSEAEARAIEVVEQDQLLPEMRDHFAGRQQRFDQPDPPYRDSFGDPVVDGFAKGGHAELGDFWIRGSQVVWSEEEARAIEAAERETLQPAVGDEWQADLERWRAEQEAATDTPTPTDDVPAAPVTTEFGTTMTPEELAARAEADRQFLADNPHLLGDPAPAGPEYGAGAKPTGSWTDADPLPGEQFDENGFLVIQPEAGESFGSGADAPPAPQPAASEYEVLNPDPPTEELVFMDPALSDPLAPAAETPDTSDAVQYEPVSDPEPDVPPDQGELVGE